MHQLIICQERSTSQIDCGFVLNGDPASSSAVLLYVSGEKYLKGAEINPTVWDDLLHGALFPTDALEHCELGSVCFEDDEEVIVTVNFNMY